MIDLGWANGWKETPALLEEAREKGYKLEMNCDPRGYDTVVTCKELNFKYHICSD